MRRRAFLTALGDSMLFAQVVSMTGMSALGRIRNSAPVDDTQHLRLFLAGDVMTGRGIDQVLPHPSKPVLYESYVKDARNYVLIAERKNGPIAKPVSYEYIWGDALNVLDARQPDLRIVNLETSVTASNEYWPGKGINYRMHPRNVACLTAADLDCCVLANNHVLDWGHVGLDETLVTLRDAGIPTAGAGENFEAAARPARLSVPGKGDVLVFSVADPSSGVPRGWSATERRGGVHRLDALSVTSADRIANLIAADRRARDVVLLSIHWGGNWGYRVPKDQRRFARHLIDTGAVDIVHGHSSHHPKGIECYKGKLIIYGCGDLITDYEGIGGHERYRPWYAPMYFATLDLRSRHVAQLDIELMVMRRFQLTRATAQDRQWLGETLNEHGRDFGTSIEVSNGNLIAGPCVAGK